jgi:putative phage-type endonuclease
MTAVDTGRRVTPTAVRVLPADADRDTWLAARRRGIGSSDLPALVGATDYRTALHVYHDKRGELDDDAGEAALWGSLLEDPVAREWQRRNRSVVHRVGLVAHEAQSWMLATLDRRVVECPLNRATRTACALEVKCRNAFTRQRWRSDVPDDVLAQTTWQLAVTGYDHIHVAVLIGGNDYRQTVVRRDARLEDYVVSMATRFREKHLLPAVPPPADLSKADAVNELDALLHPDRVGEIDIAAIGEVMEYARISARKSAADRALKAARARLGELANGHRYVKFENELAYEFGPVTRSNVDLDRLAEHHPQAYADCVSQATHYQIRIASAYRVKGDPDDQSP